MSNVWGAVPDLPLAEVANGKAHDAMKNSKSKLWISIVVLFVLVLSFLLFYTLRSARSVSVAMTGPPGLVVAGHWTVNGARGNFRATLPTNFVTPAHSLSFELIRQGEPGIFKIQLTPDRTKFGSMSVESEYGIRGDIDFRGTHENRLLASFGK